MARRACISLCASAQVQPLHRINQLIFHVLDPHFLQPIGFADALGRRIKAGHISMRDQARVVSLFIFLLTWRDQLDLVQNTSFPLCAQAISISSGPLVYGGCLPTHFPCAQRGQVNLAESSPCGGVPPHDARRWPCSTWPGGAGCAAAPGIDRSQPYSRTCIWVRL